MSRPSDCLRYGTHDWSGWTQFRAFYQEPRLSVGQLAEPTDIVVKAYRERQCRACGCAETQDWAGKIVVTDDPSRVDAELKRRSA